MRALEHATVNLLHVFTDVRPPEKRNQRGKQQAATAAALRGHSAVSVAQNHYGDFRPKLTFMLNFAAAKSGCIRRTSQRLNVLIL